MKYELPKLNYDYGALEPYIDAKTMEIHYTKHHQAYIDKLNGVLEKYPDLAEKTLEDLLKGYESFEIPDADKTLIRNHGGGHFNHSFFWNIMGPKKEVDEKLVADITSTFGSVDEFKKQFTETATKVFGSGWAWLARDENGKLHLHGMPNQDNPVMHGHTPIIGLDVWEHAYYLKYQNKRPDYITAWWNVLKII
ncbi:MAG TPA: superoxide dismutase [Candidatus Limnocylindria bacterium]|nr:superoxide dismutase [Candidatus Limnocylindria bacterium]